MHLIPLSLLAFALSQDVFVPPEVGDLAPPLGAVDYWQRGPDHVDTLPEMRGNVVVVSSYFHACEP